MYILSTKVLEKEESRYLWLGILGVTDMLLNMKNSSEIYDH
jgi:hypothetical protein